ncbi:MAG: Rpn family recombination-promoting nuclease/putative transposase [Clostridiales bacterium]|jgi:predicted transposase/invertase (TIGR01784 family)|nr:Rpn family recombination-promoting nuclease/putative transposase [Clostridiales bacterium]
MNKKSILPVKSDVIFRLFFADERNTEFLVSFLKSALDLPEDDYGDIEIADPHLLREYPQDKLGIIDIKLKTRSKKVVHIEIQLSVTPELKNRIVFYDAKLVTEQVDSGDDYSVVKRVISIVITDEVLIKRSPRYHHRFRLYDKDADVEFTDLLEIHSLELPKLPRDTDGTPLYDWTSFIAAETEEELNMLAEKDPTIGRAVVKLLELSADERARDLYERREKERRDAAMFLRDAARRGKVEGLVEGEAKGLARGLVEGSKKTIDVMRELGLSVSPEIIAQINAKLQEDTQN